MIAILGTVYFVAGRLGLMLALVNPSATAVWPPTGIALAVFLLLGYRGWPGILLGAFLVNITTAGTVATSMGIAVGNTLEGLLGAYLINRFAKGHNAFNSAQDIFKFTVLAGIACTVSATLGVTSLSLGGFAQWASYGPIWLTWWLGDAVSVLIVTPFLVLWGTNLRVQWNRDQIFEAGILLLGLILVGQTVFSEIFSSQIKHYSLEFMCIPFLIWTAFRFGQRESATAIFVLSGIAILNTLQGYGPFVRESQNESLLLLQAFMGIIAVTTLVLGAVVSERRQVEAALRGVHHESEQRVQLHTEALSSTNEALRAEVSERKRVEEALRDNRERFGAFMDNSPAVAWMKDEDWSYIYINQPFERFFNIKLEEIKGKNDFEIWPEATAKELRANDMLVLRSGKPLETFETVPTLDGAPHYWLVFKFPFKDSSGRRFVGGMAVDITGQKMGQEELEKSLSLLRATLDSTADGILVVDREGKVLSFNRKFVKMWRVPESLVTSRDDNQTLEFVLDQLKDPREFLKKIRELHQRTETESYDILEFKDGRFFEFYSQPHRTGGKSFGRVWSFRDVTERKRAEGLLVQLASFPELSPQPIVEVDLQGHVHYFNAKAARALPDIGEGGLHHPFLAGLESVAVELQKGGTGSHVREVQVGDIWYEQVIHYVELNKRIRIYGRDITDRKQAVEALEEQAVRDALTGLYNRRYFNRRVTEEIARADRHRQSLAILLCDLDHFKIVNDTQGHQIGDEVLKAVATEIKEATRGTDLVFRWGGDEMVVVLCAVIRDGVLTAADRIRNAIRNVSKRVNLDLDLSIGVSLYPEHGRDVDELIRLADRALYIAKKGGDKIHIGEEEYHLDERSIKVVFQPVVDIRSHQIIGYEALSRDAQGKLSILELFKRYQAIGQLSELKLICFRSQLKVAQEVGLKRVFINVDFDLFSRLEAISKPLGMEVILEISEVEALRDTKNHLEVTKQWREREFKFAIDDFGAGFISLPFIAQLIPDYIKMDRSTILQAVGSEKFRRFSKELVRALRNYSTEGIIAEGIETEKELKVVKEMGIYIVQGFLLGRPQELKRG